MDFELELNSNYHELSNFIEGQFYDEIFAELKYTLNQIYSVFEYYERDINSNSYGSNMTARLIDFAEEEGKNNFKKIVSRYIEYFNDSLREFHSAVLYVLENEKDIDIIKRKINGLLEDFLSDLNSFRGKASYEEFDFLEELKNMVRINVRNEDLAYDIYSELRNKGEQLREILTDDISVFIKKIISKEEDFLEELFSNIKRNDINRDFMQDNDSKYNFNLEVNDLELKEYLKSIQKLLIYIDLHSLNKKEIESCIEWSQVYEILEKAVEIAAKNNNFLELFKFGEKLSKIGYVGEYFNRILNAMNDENHYYGFQDIKRFNDLNLHGEVSWLKRENGIITFDGQYLFKFKSSNKTLQSYLDYLQKAMTIFDALSNSNEQIFSNDFRGQFSKLLDTCIKVARDNNCFKDLADFMEQASKIGSLGQNLNITIQGCYELLGSPLNKSTFDSTSKDHASHDVDGATNFGDDGNFESQVGNDKDINVEDVTIFEQPAKKQETLDTEGTVENKDVNDENIVVTIPEEPKAESVTIHTQRLKVNIKGKLSDYGLKKDPNNKGFYIPTDFDGEEQKPHRGR